MGDKQNLAKESQLALKQDKLIAGANITIALDGKTISAANPTSVTVTPVYQAGTLIAAIVVNGNASHIYAPAQHGDFSNQNLAVGFSDQVTYEVDDYVIYQENLYKCITAITTPAAWDSTKWIRALVTDELGQGGDNANQNIASTYDTTQTYDVDDYVIYAGLLYKCTTAVTTPGPFNINYWTRVLIVDEMGGSSVSTLEDLTDVDITNPAANDTIKWNATTQKWENGAGGGTGDVADVYVNGASVLDANKIAQITNYVELTQAEYDALPASKESDNILYCIKDKATADTTVAPIIYSEEEREVGVWTDGKPLYQKTYTITTDISSSTYDIDSTFVPSVYTLCKSECNYMKMGGGYAGAIFSGETVTNNAAMRVIQSETHGLHCSIDGFGSGYYSDETVITVYYTKAADTPGSGKWAPSGVPAVHYSENEQVVGTWIDGKPIYEKTFVLPNEITLTTDTWVSLGISLSGVETPISSEARNSRQAVECTVDFLDDPITAMSTMRNSSGKITSVTLRYTKSTT